MRSCCTGLDGALRHQRSAVCLQSARPRSSQATAVRQYLNATKRDVLLRRIGSHATAGSTDRESNYDSVSFRQDSGSSASTSAVIDVADNAQTETRMEEIKQFLRSELDTIFSGGVSFRPVFCGSCCFWISVSVLIVGKRVCRKSAGSAMLLI